MYLTLPDSLCVELETVLREVFFKFYFIYYTWELIFYSLWSKFLSPKQQNKSVVSALQTLLVLGCGFPILFRDFVFS